MKVMGSALMVFESIVILLAIPVAIVLENQSRTTALTLCIGLAVLCLLAVGGLRRDRRTALMTGSVVQALVLGSGLIVQALLVPGIIFTLVWVLAIALSAKTDAQRPVE